MKRLCANCHKRPALTKIFGKVRAAKDGKHDCCGQCYESLKQSARAHDLKIAMEERHGS